MYKNILVAADGSENSLRATKQAAYIASLEGDAMVKIVSVIAIDVYSDMVYARLSRMQHGFWQMPASIMRSCCCTGALPTKSFAMRRSRKPICS